MSNGNNNSGYSFGQLGTDLFNLAGGQYIAGKAGEKAAELGGLALTESSKLAQEVGEMAQFKPFTVMTGLGSAVTTPQGGYTLTLTPEQQAMQNLALSQATGFMTGVGQDPMQQALLAQASERFAGIGADPRYQSLLSQADTAFSRASADPTQARANVYQQMRDIQRPEEERRALALEERMLSQGRLGLSSDAYGGATPELLAQEKARQEAMASANLMARQQVAQEQQQEFARGLGLMGQASGMRGQELQEAMGLLSSGYTPQQQQLAAAQTMMGLGYTPQQQALASLGYGVDLAKLPQYGRQSGAELYGKAGAAGLESLMKGLGSQAAFETAGQQGLFDILGGILGNVFTPPPAVEGQDYNFTDRLTDINTALEEANLSSLDKLLPEISFDMPEPRKGEVTIGEMSPEEAAQYGYGG